MMQMSVMKMIKEIDQHSIHNYHTTYSQLINGKEKEMKQCLLPGCNNLTSKGYCCKEHFEVDRCNNKDLPRGKNKKSRKQRKAERDKRCG